MPSNFSQQVPYMPLAVQQANQSTPNYLQMLMGMGGGANPLLAGIGAGANVLSQFLAGETPQEKLAKARLGYRGDYKGALDQFANRDPYSSSAMTQDLGAFQNLLRGQQARNTAQLTKYTDLGNIGALHVAQRGMDSRLLEALLRLRGDQRTARNQHATQTMGFRGALL